MNWTEVNTGLDGRSFVLKAEAEAALAKLQEEVHELLAEQLMERCSKRDKDGWMCHDFTSTAEYAIKRLVKDGKWEWHPDAPSTCGFRELAQQAETEPKGNNDNE